MLCFSGDQARNLVVSPILEDVAHLEHLGILAWLSS